MVTTLRFISYKGKDFNKVCRFIDTDGNIINTTGYVFNYVLKETFDGPAVLTKTALTHVDDVAGTFRIAIDAVDTTSLFLSSSILSKTYYCQIYGVDLNGEKAVWGDGTHEIRKALS